MPNASFSRGCGDAYTRCTGRVGVLPCGAACVHAPHRSECQVMKPHAHNTVLMQFDSVLFVEWNLLMLDRTQLCNP